MTKSKATILFLTLAACDLTIPPSEEVGSETSETGDEVDPYDPNLNDCPVLGLDLNGDKKDDLSLCMHTCSSDVSCPNNPGGAVCYDVTQLGDYACLPLCDPEMPGSCGGGAQCLHVNDGAYVCMY